MRAREPTQTKIRSEAALFLPRQTFVNGRRGMGVTAQRSHSAKLATLTPPTPGWTGASGQHPSSLPRASEREKGDKNGPSVRGSSGSCQCERAMTATDLEAAARPASSTASAPAQRRLWRRVALAASVVFAVTACLAVAVLRGDSRGACITRCPGQAALPLPGPPPLGRGVGIWLTACLRCLRQVLR